MAVKGIDVSGNNGSIDWHKVAHEGEVKFVYLKVNEGDWIDKSTTPARVKEARSNGLLVGGYNFVRPRPGRSGAKEFDIFYKHAKAAGLLEKGSLRPVIDIEVTGFTGPTAALRTRRYVRSWIRQCVKRLGVNPVIYTGSWFWDGVMKGNKYTTQNCHLWLAAYVSESRVKQFIPKGFDHISIWQYTSKGRVPGIHSNVDVDRYLGHWTTFKRYKLQKSA